MGNEINQICIDCISSDSVRKLLKDDLRVSHCDVCESVNRCASIETIGDFISNPIQLGYRWGEPDLYSRYGGDNGDDLTTILQEELGIDFEESEALAEYLYENDPAYPGDGEEAFFDREKSYVRDFHSYSHSKYDWEHYSQKIKHHSRFYGPLQDFIKEIFSLPPIFPESGANLLSAVSEF